MNQIASLLTCCEHFAEARRLSESSVSTLVFNDGKRIRRIRNGSDIGARQIDRAIQWFADHWPNGAAWPAGVVRPVGV